MSRSEKNPDNEPADGKSAPWPRRLDTVAAEAAQISRRQAQRLIADGAVSLNGQIAAAGEKGRMIGPKDRVRVAADVGRILPQPDLQITELASAPGWVAVDKPAGMPVHPLHEGETDTVLNAIAARYPEVQGVGLIGGEGGLRSGVVHRLDTDTSGVLLVALDDERWTRFRVAFAEHRTTKIYAAVLEGGLHEASGYADVWLAVTRHRPAYVEVVDRGTAGARRCTLSWKVTGRVAGLTAVDVELDTGFLHQIRATFRHLGTPVRGDRIYGSGETQENACRLMLHARRLKIDDIEIECPPPDEFGV